MSQTLFPSNGSAENRKKGLATRDYVNGESAYILIQSRDKKVAQTVLEHEMICKWTKTASEYRVCSFVRLVLGLSPLIALSMIFPNEKGVR